MPTRRSARKTTDLTPASESDTADRPVRLRLLDRLENTTKCIGYIMVILLVVMVGRRMIIDMWNWPILLDPLIVPKAMEDQGYTGLVAANRVADEIDRIEHTIRPKISARKDKFILASSETLPEVEIPETKLSLASVIGLLENFLGIARDHTSARNSLSPLPTGRKRGRLFPIGSAWSFPFA